MRGRKIANITCDLLLKDVKTTMLTLQFNNYFVGFAAFFSRRTFIHLMWTLNPFLSNVNINAVSHGKSWSNGQHSHNLYKCSEELYMFS